MLGLGHVTISLSHSNSSVSLCPPGWQPRWFVLDGGTLSYYDSQEEAWKGCKGSIKISVCEIQGRGYLCLSVSLWGISVSLSLSGLKGR